MYLDCRACVSSAWLGCEARFMRMNLAWLPRPFCMTSTRPSDACIKHVPACAGPGAGWMPATNHVLSVLICKVAKHLRLSQGPSFTQRKADLKFGVLEVLSCIRFSSVQGVRLSSAYIQPSPHRIVCRPFPGPTRGAAATLGGFSPCPYIVV
jgi:hypothetical protein